MHCGGERVARQGPPPECDAWKRGYIASSLPVVAGGAHWLAPRLAGAFRRKPGESAVSIHAKSAPVLHPAPVRRPHLILRRPLPLPLPAQLTSLPGALLLYDNGTLDRSLPLLAGLNAVGGSLMLYGKAGLGDGGLKSLQPLQAVAVGGVEWLRRVAVTWCRFADGRRLRDCYLGLP